MASAAFTFHNISDDLCFLSYLIPLLCISPISCLCQHVSGALVQFIKHRFFLQIVSDTVTF